MYNELVSITDANGRIRYLNKKGECLFGRNPGELQGSYFHELICAGEDQMTQISRDLARQGFWRGNLKTRMAGGNSRELQLRVSLAPNDASTTIIIGTDISEKHEIEEKFLRAQRLELVGEISAGLAHDLNNVLTPITLAADAYGPNKSEKELSHLKGIMTQGCRRASSIVRQFLSFARGQQDVCVSLQVESLLEEVADMARETFPQSIKVEARTSANLWPVRGNPTQFHQILMNLCVNARDAMVDGGILTLTAENVSLDEQFCLVAPNSRSGKFLRVCVMDTGTGISPENLQKLWQPFFTTKPVGRGTGLGLSTVKRLLEEEHRGFLRLVTNPGHGTRFELYFPVSNGKQQASNSGEN